ncbi:MAG: tetratricopeptide repeat protein [Gemmatimonadota bacterium]
MTRRAARAFLPLVLVLALPACADPARERFERAEKSLLAQKMDAALADYRSIPRDYPQSRYAPAALLRQGDLFGSFYRNYAAALETYDSLVFNYPQAAEVPRALMRKGEICLLQLFDYPAAIAELERVRTQYPRFEEKDEALYLLAKAYAGRGDPARQQAVLLELIETRPDSPRAMEARWAVAYVLLAQGTFADADREFRKILYLVTDRKEAARARWGIAQALEGEGELAAALEQYEAIGADGEDPAFLAAKIARLKKRLKTS